VVAVSNSQQEHLKQLYQHATSLPDPPGSVPVRLISGQEARELEPDLSEDVCGALLSPETGIVDAHSLIERMETEMVDNADAATVYGTSVVRIDKSTDEGRGAKGKRGDSGNPGWVVQTESEGGDRSAILARCVINSAGLR
jgi:2-hydroxyglutarate dehydrogenase